MFFLHSLMIIQCGEFVEARRRKAGLRAGEVYRVELTLLMERLRATLGRLNVINLPDPEKGFAMNKNTTTCENGIAVQTMRRECAAGLVVRLVTMLVCGSTAFWFLPPLFKNQGEAFQTVYHGMAALGPWCFVTLALLDIGMAIARTIEIGWSGYRRESPSGGSLVVIEAIALSLIGLWTL
jgi:hypothetical protein